MSFPDPALPCILLTGLRGSGKTRWLHTFIEEVLRRDSGARVLVLLSEEGRTRMETFCERNQGVIVHRLPLPCYCCPGLVELPSVLQQWAERVRPKWVILEVPAPAAAGIREEIERIPVHPLYLVRCENQERKDLSYRPGLLPFLDAIHDPAYLRASDSESRLQAIAAILGTKDAEFPPAY